MKRTVPEIQLHETGADFPYRMMIVEKSSDLNYWHVETEIIQALDGNMNVWVNGVEYHLEQGEILLIPSGNTHRVDKPDRRHRVIQFDLVMFEQKNLKYDFVRSIREKLERLERCSRKWGREAQCTVAGIIEQMEGEDISMPGDHTSYVIKTQSLLYQLINILWNDIPESTDSSAGEGLYFDKKMMYKLEQVILYIKNNYFRDITLKDVSQIANYSVNHFTKIWYKYIGTHFHTYLNDYRVNEAASLLRNTNFTVSEIALKCGFGSYKTFGRVFKAAHGAAAAEYRRKFALK